MTHSKQEYQIAGALERGNPVGLMGETYADYNQAVVSGKYNGSILGKTIGSDLYIFGVPSIVALTEVDIEIQDIIAQDKFVLNKYSAIPKGLETAESASNRSVSFTPSTHTDGILFQGSSESLASPSGSLELAQSLYDFYQGSSLADTEAIISFTHSDPSITANEVQASNSVNYLLDSISLIESESIQVVSQSPTTPTSQQITRRDYSSAMNSSNGFYNSKTIPNSYAFAALKSDGSISAW